LILAAVIPLLCFAFNVHVKIMYYKFLFCNFSGWPEIAFIRPVAIKKLETFRVRVSLHMTVIIEDTGMC
jgi:hypothetical protein